MSTALAVSLGILFLRAALLLACFWIAYWLLRGNPRARVMLCRMVCVAVVLLPALGFLPVPAILRLPEWGRAAAPVISEPPAPADLPPAQAIHLPIIHEDNTLQTASVPVSTSVRTSVHAWHMPRPTPAETLVTVWIAVAGLLLARRGFVLLAAHRATVAASHAPPDWISAEAARLAERIGIRRDVTVRVIEKDCSPLLIGPRPVILLPRRLASEATREDTLAALAHELVHVKQHDWHWSQWLHCVGILAWPLPPAWFLRRAHDAASELVCDSVAAGIAGDAESYAGALARQSLLSLGRALPAAVPMLRKSGIRRRIERLLSGATLPALTRRAVCVAALFTFLLAASLSGVRRARAESEAPAKDVATAAQPVDIGKELKALANETNYFEINLFLSGYAAYIPGGSEEDNRKYQDVVKRLRSLHATKEELLPLLQQRTDDPSAAKIRTLAIAALVALDDPSVLPAIADQLADSSPTFSREGALAQSKMEPRSIRSDVTVGEDAQEALYFYLSPAGYNGYQLNGHRTEEQKSRAEFDRYWAAHKDLKYCLSWFAERLNRLSYAPVIQRQPGDPLDSRRAERLLAVRADLDKVPQPDRIWFAFWLQKTHPTETLYSFVELYDMGAKLGPETFLDVLKTRKIPTNDPDLKSKAAQTYDENLEIVTQFILENASGLLRPSDAGELAKAGASAHSALYFTAAAQLQTGDAAVKILRSGYETLAGNGMQDEHSFLGVALWKTGGESQTQFLVDTFYHDVNNDDGKSSSSWAQNFISGIASVEKPSGRKLVAAILKDPRLSDLKLGGSAFITLAKEINSWADKQVSTDEEIHKAAGTWAMKSSKAVPPDDALRQTLLHRMAESAPQWLPPGD